MMETITSARNPRIRNIIQLQKPRERRNQQLFSVEGFREISLAAGSGYEPDSLFFCEAVAGKGEMEKVAALLGDCCKLFEIPLHIFETIAYRSGSDGMLALFRMKSLGFEHIKTGENPLVIVLETVEKPGNLGAIIRTAEAAGVDAILVCNPQTDIYNPNVIRSSLGCVFKVPVIASSNEEALVWLDQNRITVVATWLRATKTVFQADFTNPVAIVLGSEAKGISDFWIDNSSEQILIPMFGKINSINVASAAAIALYECVRQRTASALP